MKVVRALKFIYLIFLICLHFILGLPIGLRLLDGLNCIKVKIEPTDTDDVVDQMGHQLELEMQAQSIQPPNFNCEKKNRDPRLARLDPNGNGSVNTNRANIHPSTSGHQNDRVNFQASTSRYQNGNATDTHAYNFNGGGHNINNVNFQASTSGLQNGNSSAYFGTRPFVSAETTAHAHAKQRTFLAGTITASDFISGSSQRGTDYQQKVIRDAQNAAGKFLNMMNVPPPSFISNIPTGPFLEGGHAQQRSPLTVSNRNALFLSQASSGNVQEALLAQRYRNIPQNTQAIGVQIGADLDALSRNIKSESADASSSEIVFIDNTRTIFTQTDFPSDAPTPVQPEPSTKTFKDRGMQTITNNGSFSITIDHLADLTKEQRKALEDFKKVNSLDDDLVQ